MAGVLSEILLTFAISQITKRHACFLVLTSAHPETS